jgi:hypothetical protein
VWGEEGIVMGLSAICNIERSYSAGRKEVEAVREYVNQWK